MEPSSYLPHLTELRKRLIQSSVIFLILAAILLPFSNFLYTVLAHPLLAKLPQSSHLIATEISAPFFVPLKFATLVAFFLGMPFFLHQLWAFIAPALYQKERLWWGGILTSSIILFALGVTFAYYVVLPFLFQFFVKTTPKEILLLPDMSNYLTLCLQFLLAFGLAFEVPIAMILLVASGVVSVSSLKNKRRYFILGAFIAAMFITPPDVMSQTLFAVPLCLLFEAGLLAAKFVETLHATS